MWQIQWMWSLIPIGVLHWIINLLLVIGVIGTAASWIAKWIPFVASYRGPVQLIGIICLVLGVYFKGGYSVEQAWRDKVAKLEEQVRASEVKSKAANRQLDVAIKEKNQAIKDKQKSTQSRIQQQSQRIDSECKVDSEVIEILNDSARDIARTKAKK
jgi:hypothetical protein